MKDVREKVISKLKGQKFECDGCGEQFEDMPKCESCGSEMENEDDIWCSGEYHFCSENCIATYFGSEARINKVEEENNG